MPELIGKKPFYEKKDVILCRSGIQEYDYDEVLRFGISEFPIKKDVYKVYRPASVIIASLDKMKNLPITKEHPYEFISGDNWSSYAKGYTGSEAEVVPIGGGEIGVKSSLFFSTSEIYNYYLDGNKEVSLGYQSVNKFVPNPDEVGYDIIMTDIISCNHLAVTKSGRGGHRVSIIDSIIGGLPMFKTGLFHFLKKKGKTNDSVAPFSTRVFESIENSKDKTGAELQAEVSKVIDSLSTLKDGEAKTLVIDSVTDCFKAPSEALANKEDVSKFLDSVYNKAEQETIRTVSSYTNSDADEDKKEKEEKMTKDKEMEEEEEEEEEVTEDEEVKGTSPKEESGTKDEDGKGKGTANISDSIVALVNDALSKNNEKLSLLIDKKIKDALGLVDTQGTKGGVVADSDVSQLQSIDIAKYVL